MSHYEPIPLAANELWIPGENYSIDAEYPTPTQDELCDLWHDYTGANATVVATPGVYGAMRVPTKLPLAYVSVDACEVLRTTNMDIIAAQRSAEHITDNPIKSIHRYGEGCTYEDNYADIQSLAQVLIGEDLIKPVNGITEIALAMNRWRRMGAYIVANTSTLPGCEPGTIRFFDRYMPGAFDAILLPRNHNSDASLATKGDVAAQLMLATEQAAFQDKAPDMLLRRDVTAVHIDDKSCHNVAFRNSIAALGASVYTVQPVYPSHHEIDPESIRTATPLEAFRLVNTLIRYEARQATNS